MEFAITGVLPQARTSSLRERVSKLYLEAREDVYRYLLTLGLDPAHAQEATQEVFLRLYTALRKGEEIQSARAWIFRVAHNLGLKIRSKRDPYTPLTPEIEVRAASPEPGPEESLIDRERMLRFHRAVGNLSEQQRRCLFLRLEGLRYAEIGSTLGISASAAGEFLRRAVARLKKVNE